MPLGELEMWEWELSTPHLKKNLEAFFTWRVGVPSYKIVMTPPRTNEKLNYKGESYRNRYPTVQTDRQTKIRLLTL